MEQLNQIIVPHGNQAEIAKVMECDLSYVSMALKGKRTKDKALKIRHVALTQFGGQEVQIVPVQKKKRRK